LAQNDFIPQTLLLNGAVLAKNKQNTEGGKKEALKELLAHAEKVLKAGKLYSVMNKKRIPASGDMHDYMSQAPYWWADSTKPNGLPYIRRDGERNPEYYLISDSDEMDKVIDDSEIMGLAYFYTRDERYAAHAARLIKTWFLNKETRQNPNLNYSQGIPGINTGRGIGIIETRDFVRLIDAAILLRGSKNWSNEDQTALKQWFSAFLTWLTDSPLGKDEAGEHNNHGTFYDAQVVAYAIFTDKPDLAKKQIDVTKTRIKSQIEPDGSQPHELARTVSFGYVNMNLYGFFTIARLAEHVNTDLWQYKAAEGKNLQNGVDWLVPYLKKEKKWTHQQIKKMSYEDTVKVLSMASKAYSNPAYDALAKKVDEQTYQSYMHQLTF
jgi:Alginate lyase